MAPMFVAMDVHRTRSVSLVGGSLVLEGIAPPGHPTHGSLPVVACEPLGPRLASLWRTASQHAFQSI